MNLYDAIEMLIFKATGVPVDGKAVWAEVEEAGSETTENGSQWVTGQDNCRECWEYYIDAQHDAETDEDGEIIQSWTDVRLLEVKITPRGKESVFYDGSNLNKPYYIQIANAKF